MRLHVGLKDPLDITSVTRELAIQDAALFDSMAVLDTRMPEILTALSEYRTQQSWGNYLKTYATLKLLRPDDVVGFELTAEEIVSMESDEFAFQDPDDYNYYILASPEAGLKFIANSDIAGEIALKIEEGRQLVQSSEADVSDILDLLESAADYVFFTGKVTPITLTAEQIEIYVAYCVRSFNDGVTAVGAASLADARLVLGNQLDRYQNQFDWQKVVTDIETEHSLDDAVERLFHLQLAINPNINVSQYEVSIGATHKDDISIPLPPQLIIST